MLIIFTEGKKPHVNIEYEPEQERLSQVESENQW